MTLIQGRHLPMKADFHLHTLDDPWDRHVDHTAEELFDKAAAEGFEVLALTLHGRQIDCDRLRQEAADRGIRLIPGVEADVEGAHVLLLGFPTVWADAVRDYSSLRAAREACPEGVVIAPHPFFPQGICVRHALFREADAFDGVEWTGFHHRFWNPNLQARAAAESLGLPLIGNSDTHTLEQFGKTWTEFPELKRAPDGLPDTRAVLRALREGLGKPCGRPLSAAEMAWIAWRVVIRGYLPVNSRKRRGHIPQVWKEGKAHPFPVR